MENLRITESIQQNLLSAAKWLKFITIVSTVGLGLLFIVGIVLMFIPTYSDVPGAVLGICYMLMTLFYVYPIKKMYELVGNVRESMLNYSQESMEEAACNVNSILKYCGIFTIICLSIYAVIAVFGIIAAVALSYYLG